MKRTVCLACRCRATDFSQVLLFVLASILLQFPWTVNSASENSPDAIPVCYNYNCNQQHRVTLTVEEWRGVAGWFQSNIDNAEDERERIRRAIGWMEVVVGNHVPTHRDKGQNNAPGAIWPGQMDCIDESVNTTTYLELFRDKGLLKFHKVLDRAQRKAIFDQHFAAQIMDKQGQTYVVDSWFQDNGYLPVVQPTSTWKNIPFLFTSFFDTSEEPD